MISSAWFKHGYLMRATLVFQVFLFIHKRENKKIKKQKIKKIKNSGFNFKFLKVQMT